MENDSLALQTLRDSVEAVWAGNANGLFDVLEAVPQDEIEPLMIVTDLAFARAAHDVLGKESSIDRMVLVARSLDEGALRVIKPLPYLFEKLIRRQYGEAAIIEDVSMEQVILHSVVGAALLRPHDMERLLQDVSTPAEGPKTIVASSVQAARDSSAERLLIEMLYEAIEAATEKDIEKLLETVQRWARTSSDEAAIAGVQVVLFAVWVGLKETLAVNPVDETTADALASTGSSWWPDLPSDFGVSRDALQELLLECSSLPILVPDETEDDLGNALLLGLLGLSSILALPPAPGLVSPDGIVLLGTLPDSVVLGGRADPVARLTVLLELMGFDTGNLELV